MVLEWFRALGFGCELENLEWRLRRLGVMGMGSLGRHLLGSLSLISGGNVGMAAFGRRARFGNFFFTIKIDFFFLSLF